MDAKYTVLKKHTQIDPAVWGPAGDIFRAMEEYAELKLTEYKATQQQPEIPDTNEAFENLANNYGLQK